MPQRRKLKMIIWFIFLILIILISIIPLRLAITLKQFPQPQAIFVLGGNLNRFREAALFSQLHPHLDLWLSTTHREMPRVIDIFHKANIPEQQTHYDLSATDTVTNFTCVVDDLITKKIFHLYLITSDYHMGRAYAIATLVFGSRGIAVTPIPVASNYPEESLLRIVRDCFRSLLWLVTGKSGASFNPKLN